MSISTGVGGSGVGDSGHTNKGGCFTAGYKFNLIGFTGAAEGYLKGIFRKRRVEVDNRKIQFSLRTGVDDIINVWGQSKFQISWSYRKFRIRFQHPNILYKLQSIKAWTFSVNPRFLDS